MIKKIVSGGQTGVDRAALDIAIELNITYGGWCPKGRLDENGIIPSKYKNLTEHNRFFRCEKDNYDARTQLNISDSDGTLILVPAMPLPNKIKDGTNLTITDVIYQKKPYLIINLALSFEENFIHFNKWINENNIEILNIAGPRESNSLGIYHDCCDFLRNAILKLDSTFFLNM